jgi:hypothetical protein
MSKNILEIDKFNLDVEWARQPQLYYEYAEKLAQARSNLERERNRKEVRLAELERLIRENPQIHGIEGKPTEASIQAAIKVHKTYTNVNKKVAEAQYEVNICFAMVEALDHKKRGLEQMVSLDARNYYAKPYTRVDHKQRQDSLNKKAFDKRGK